MRQNPEYSSTPAATLRSSRSSASRRGRAEASPTTAGACLPPPVAVLEGVGEQVVLVAEVPVDRAGRQAARLGDLGDGGADVTALARDPQGDVEDRAAGGVPLRVRPAALPRHRSTPVVDRGGDHRSPSLVRWCPASASLRACRAGRWCSPRGAPQRPRRPSSSPSPGRSRRRADTGGGTAAPSRNWLAPSSAEAVPAACPWGARASAVALPMRPPEAGQHEPERDERDRRRRVRT